jgi:hypothetical protein
MTMAVRQMMTELRQGVSQLDLTKHCRNSAEEEQRGLEGSEVRTFI